MNDNQVRAYKRILQLQESMRRTLGDMRRNAAGFQDDVLENTLEQINHRLLLIEGHVSEVLSGRVDKGKGK